MRRSHARPNQHPLPLLRGSNSGPPTRPNLSERRTAKTRPCCQGRDCLAQWLKIQGREVVGQPPSDPCVGENQKWPTQRPPPPPQQSRHPQTGLSRSTSCAASPSPS